MTLIPPGLMIERLRTLLNDLLSIRGVNLTDVTVTVDPPSLATGSVSTIADVTVTGAALGDFVKASFNVDMQGVCLHAWVSAADTVAYQFYNPTAGTVDLASGTLRLRVEQATP